MAWTDESKAKAEELYLAKEPTEENTMEVLAEVADEMGETVNGVRMILTKRGVYIKKPAGSKPAAASASKAGGAASTRVSKEDSHNALVEAIKAHGQEGDMEIISKMTGKAAQHFTALFNAITPSEAVD